MPSPRRKIPDAPKPTPGATEGLAIATRPRLCVLGGSFDPVHNGHLFLAGELLRSRTVDEVLFVPARHPPHKVGSRLTACEHRWNMLELALEPYPQFSVSDIELTREDELSYSFDTLTVLRQVFPGHELCFLIGMDSLVDLHTWHRATELVQRFRLLVYPRPGTRQPTFAELSGHFGPRNARRIVDSILSLPTIAVASTEIRKHVAKNKTLAGWVPESVLRYISEHALYASADAEPPE